MKHIFSIISQEKKISNHYHNFFSDHNEEVENIKSFSINVGMTYLVHLLVFFHLRFGPRL